MSTLVSNPATYGPLYYAAWRLGKAVLGHEVGDNEAPPVTGPQTPPVNGCGWIRKAWDGVTALGKPLLRELGAGAEDPLAAAAPAARARRGAP